jgi:hypothetical protein
VPGRIPPGGAHSFFLGAVLAFAEFAEMTVVKRKGSVESLYLNRQGATFDQLLVDDGTFGSMEEIARALYHFQPRART